MLPPTWCAFYTASRPRGKWGTDHGFIVRSDNKKRARLNCNPHLLGQIPHKELPREKVDLGKRSMKGKYDDQAALEGKSFIPKLY